jgi:phosphopantetheinyl transferase (holo-ACP synthase)
MNNIFCLCAGRTASTSFAKACSHITNFTSAHESLVSTLSTRRLDYPSHHIEIDNRLVWFLPQLNKKFADEDTFYVHLKRNKIDVAKSYLERWHIKESIVKAYGHGILMKNKISEAKKMSICLDYVEHVESSIDIFLENRTNKMVMDITNLKQTFPEFHHKIQAEGNLNLCLDEFDKISNKNKTNIVKANFKKIIRLFN